jgi:hypothetical protein
MNGKSTVSTKTINFDDLMIFTEVFDVDVVSCAVFHGLYTGFANVYK